MSRPADTRCKEHDVEMVYSAIGSVRCPVSGCQSWRKTECGAFVRRLRPAGRNLVCRQPVTTETWAVLPDGREVYHGGNCNAHPDRARYGGNSGARIEYREVSR